MHNGLSLYDIIYTLGLAHWSEIVCVGESITSCMVTVEKTRVLLLTVFCFLLVIILIIFGSS